MPLELWGHFFQTGQRGGKVVGLDLTPDPRESVETTDDEVDGEQAKETQKPDRGVHVGGDGEDLKQVGGGLSIAINIPLEALFLGNDCPDN